MQRGVAKGLKVPCLFKIAEVSIRCQKNPGGWYTPYTCVYPPIHHWHREPYGTGYPTWDPSALAHRNCWVPARNPVRAPRRMPHGPERKPTGLTIGR